MKLSELPPRRPPIFPLIALAIVLYLNIMNRCADGWCYTYGWPWVAVYGWSDAQGTINGETRSPIVWLPFLGDLLVASLILVVGWWLHRSWRKRHAV